jgi:hypothetical protein
VQANEISKQIAKSLKPGAFPVTPSASADGQKQNIRLSERRARSVANLLVDHLSMPKNVLPEASFHLKILSNTHYC